MENNKENNLASTARKKRKMVLDGKGRMSFRRTPPQLTTPPTTYSHITPLSNTSSQSLRTPLSNITTQAFNQRNQFNILPNSSQSNTSNITFHGTTDTIPSQSKRRVVEVGNVGINLMNRFGYVNSNLPFQSQAASSSRMPTPIQKPGTKDFSIHDSTSDEDDFLSNHTLYLPSNS